MNSDRVVERSNRGVISAGVVELEIKGKKPILRIFLIALLVLLPIICIGDMATADYGSGAGELVFLAVVLASFLLLRKDHYRAAARLTAMVFWLGMLYLGLNHPFTNTAGVYQVIVYLAAALGFASLFLVENGIPTVMATLNLLVPVAYLVAGFSSSMAFGALAVDTLAAVVFALLLDVFILVPTRMGRGISGELDREKRSGEARAAVLEAAASRSEANLGSIGALSERVLEIRSASEAALESVSKIEASLADLDSAADAATAEASSIGSRVDELNGHIETEVSAQEESAASVNQMVSSISSVADSAVARRESLAGLRETAEEGERRLAALIEAIGRISGSVGSIRDMIAVINKIASSTNLLAMNASIEAAHAGDAGKGFSVVADEIRGLAEGSSRNAKEIGVKLKEVVAAINEASEGGGRAGESFAGMKKEIDRAMDSFAEIATATEELSAGGRQILESIAALNEASQGLRESGSAIGQAKGRLIELQSRAKEGVGRVLSEARSVAARAVGLRSSAEAVSEVAQRSSREAAELHASMKGGA
jgi:methyl-accepting chemotaxis protein